MQNTTQSPRLPEWFIWSTIFISILPLFLNILGANFGLEAKPLDLQAAATMTAAELANALHKNLAGSLTHTMLEWSAVCAAFFTVVLSLSYFRYKRDGITPIIGISLFCAGMMDLFHLLAANRVISSLANTTDLVNFTWALCRLANASLTILGVSLFLLRGTNRKQLQFSSLLSYSACLGVFAAGIIYFCTITPELPQTVFPDSIIRRPYDVLPLFLYAISGLFIFPRFYKIYPGLFSQALLISTIPNIAAQLHMAFGAKVSFDNNFNIGHFFKIIGYLVPLIGLVLDYSSTYQRLGSLANSAQEVGEGNLTVSIEVNDEKDEIGRVLIAFRNMIYNLNALIHQVQQTGNKISASATEIATSGKELEATMIKQVASTNQVTATAKAIANTSGELVKTVAQVELVSQVTAAQASASQKDLNDMEVTMRNLANGTNVISDNLAAINEKANKINNMIVSMTLISDRTNLLSLNASIEAEKAGDYGKGFSVVATEISRLADQASVSTLDIEKMVKEMQDAVAIGVKEMSNFTNQVKISAENVHEISEKLEGIIKQVQTLSPRFQEVSAGMGKQSEGAIQISEAMLYLSQDCLQTADSLRGVNRVIEQLNEVTQELRLGISKFQV